MSQPPRLFLWCIRILQRWSERGLFCRVTLLMNPIPNTLHSKISTSLSCAGGMTVTATTGTETDATVTDRGMFSPLYTRSLLLQNISVFFPSFFSPLPSEKNLYQLTTGWRMWPTRTAIVHRITLVWRRCPRSKHTLCNFGRKKEGGENCAS